MSSAADKTSPAPSASRNPFEIARSHLIRRLLELEVPPAHAIAEAPDLIRDAANIFDGWLRQVGEHVADVTDASSEPINLDLFTGQFLGAVDGNATYAVEQAMEFAPRRYTMRRA
jgi:hypothetical protein